MLKLFIAGTDTEIGKTYVSSGLLMACKQFNLATLGLKPIASGCIKKNGRLLNDDTLALINASTLKLPHETITPFAFEPPIAPHVAAKQVNCSLSVNDLISKTKTIFQQAANVFIIEGCGGWYTPLNVKETMANYVITENFNVILVVGIKLGCINHALLTYQAIKKDGANIIGWVANQVDKSMLLPKESIAYLQNQLPIPCLGLIEYSMPPQDILDIKTILQLTRNS